MIEGIVRVASTKMARGFEQSQRECMNEELYKGWFRLDCILPPPVLWTSFLLHYFYAMLSTEIDLAEALM